MAESRSSKKTMSKSSETLPDVYCDPCHDVEGIVCQAVAFCNDCTEGLCYDCLSVHKKLKITRNHQIDQKKQRKGHNYNAEDCHRHKGEKIQSYCRSCDHLCCNVCQNVDHHVCVLESLTSASADIKDSKQLKSLDTKLIALKKGYDYNLRKAENHTLDIDTHYAKAIKEMKKLYEVFEEILAETEQQAEQVKTEDLKKMDSVVMICNILLTQINSLLLNIEESLKKGDSEKLFISMKRAEGELQSLKDRLGKLDKDNTIRHYMFEPEEKLNTMLKEQETFGKLSYFETNSNPMPKTPIFLKDIDLQSRNIRGSITLPNQHILITDIASYKVKLIDTKQNHIVAELKLPDYPWDLTRVKADEVAITRYSAKKIQFVSVSSSKLYTRREMQVGGECMGIEYDNRNETLIVTFQEPPKVEILSLTGRVVKRIERDSKGAKLFVLPYYVTQSIDKTLIYVTDYKQHTVISLTLNGDVKIVYKDKQLTSPAGICVARSGIVFVVGCDSNNVYQIIADDFEPCLEYKNGLNNPWTVTYCDTEDRLYVGQATCENLKVFEMV